MANFRLDFFYLVDHEIFYGQLHFFPLANLITERKKIIWMLVESNLCELASQANALTITPRPLKREMP